ncbi:MAG: prolipoprotein diacylglyceryl transferase [Deltaproteobacteria bacterium]|nr:prolipoprotein diacylglyceryl transferase [Deltaproteobacteria bacterium]
MQPILFQIGSLTIYSYGLMTFVKLVVIVGIIVLTARKDWQPDLRAKYGFGLVALQAIFVILLAPLAFIVYVVLYVRDRENRYHFYFGAYPFILFVAFAAGRIFAAVYYGQSPFAYGFFSGGINIWAVYIAILIMLVVFALLKLIPFFKTLDVALAAGCVGYAIGKLGCFLAGCCHGTPCDLPWCLSFPAGTQAAFEFQAERIASTPVTSLPVHPLQLYEFFLYLGLGLVALVLINRKKKLSGIIGLVGMLIAIAINLALSPLRAGPILGFWENYKMSLIAAIVIGFALIAYLVIRSIVNKEETVDTEGTG